MLEPESHLRIFVLTVGRTVGFFGEVYVEALCIFCVEIVGAAQSLDEISIMPQKVVMDKGKGNP